MNAIHLRQIPEPGCQRINLRALHGCYSRVNGSVDKLTINLECGEMDCTKAHLIAAVARVLFRPNPLVSVLTEASHVRPGNPSALPLSRTLIDIWDSWFVRITTGPNHPSPSPYPLHKDLRPFSPGYCVPHRKEWNLVLAYILQVEC